MGPHGHEEASGHENERNGIPGVSPPSQPGAAGRRPRRIARTGPRCIYDAEPREPTPGDADRPETDGLPRAGHTPATCPATPDEAVASGPYHTARSRAAAGHGRAHISDHRAHALSHLLGCTGSAGCSPSTNLHEPLRKCTRAWCTTDRVSGNTLPGDHDVATSR